MSSLPALPVVLPLLAAPLSMLCRRHLWLQRALGLVALTAVLVVDVLMLLDVDGGSPLVTQVGGLPAPLGITLVVDGFAALMLVVSAAMFIAVLVYAIGQGNTDKTSWVFHPVYLVLAAGVGAAFVAGDLFNLFVSFEIMLTASYVLITLGATREQVRSGMTYVVISLVASVLFLVSVGLVYAATGTVNLADLSEKIGTVPSELRVAFALMFFVVFGIKAAIFPLFFWLPDAYPTAPSPVTAIFAGLLTKVGVYAIFRTETLVFLPDLDGVATVVLVIAGLTMLVGVLGAIAQNDIKRILSFHIISQIGYMILGLGLFTVAGIAAAIFYVVHHIVVKTTLFLVGGLVEHGTGTGSLARLSGIVRRAPVLGLLFLLPALSLGGIPPFSGFIAKLAIIEAGFSVDDYLIIGISLLVGLLTLFSMTKIWSGAFWGTAEHAPGAAPTRLRSPALMLTATWALAILSLAIAIGASGLYEVSERAARDLLDPSAYVQEVLAR